MWVTYQLHTEDIRETLYLQDSSMSVKDKIIPSVTYQLHTLCPEWDIPLVVPALVLRLLLLNLSCNQSILYDARCHRIIMFVNPKTFPKGIKKGT